MVGSRPIRSETAPKNGRASPLSTLSTTSATLRVETLRNSFTLQPAVHDGRGSTPPSSGAAMGALGNGVGMPAGGQARPPANALEDAERAVVESALARASGVVSRAAAELGLSRQALYRRMDRLGIAIERRVR